ncbi:PP2C family protein-serine/threonine phosphatase [Sinomonas susongensis]|uniref:PP2C family protein-serine/threonine phosphatase n=1 Tax=Sinomonas susongensis TaxID=1324851 RepID=UPI001108A197|nr:protein phosphatase 2C domain-containing protein [Sinomonas susongensis]
MAGGEETPEHPTHLVFDVGAATDRGAIRELNEDSYLAREPVFAVADGMGGHEAGEVASGLCIEALADEDMLVPGQPVTMLDVVLAVRRADWAIREATGSRAGTTLAAAFSAQDDEGAPAWIVANVGDSRVYVTDHGEFDQITVDHSEVWELVARGEITREEARVHPRRNVVTRALGTGYDADPDLWLLPAFPGQRLLVCSDGLTTELEDLEIASILRRNPTSQGAADALVAAALESGGRDNVTVVVVGVEAAVDDAAPVSEG